MATNRIDSLDPALIRPGRIDRKIEFPLPDEKTKRRIFNIHTSRMQLSDDVDLEEYIMAKDELSGADIKVGSAPVLLSYFSYLSLFSPFFPLLSFYFSLNLALYVFPFSFVRGNLFSIHRLFAPRQV